MNPNDPNRTGAPERFLNLLRESRRGKFKVYIGMSAGVGKSYRMLQEAHALLRSGFDVAIGFIETHGRAETEALVPGLPQIGRRRLFYKGRQLEEMDTQAILNRHPELVIVDELAHSNIPGSKHEKRWQDVLEILDAGINVISAVNIQHIESLYDEVRGITGVDVTERVPDRVLQLADEVVNIDLTADELITRLREGKIYDPAKVQTALNHFFQPEKILQLRELALREVASAVERKIDTLLTPNGVSRPERFLAAISSSAEVARRVIRKTARLAAYYNSRWYVLYVQTPAEAPDQIRLDVQRHLINNLKLATELGAEVVQVKGTDVVECIMQEVQQRGVTTVCMGKPHVNLVQVIWRTFAFNRLLNRLSESDTDLIILS
ncbi:sensor protein KdpD [Rudanella paleaurantiibacter]|uniref:Sensor protein KdpD n=1 Tax=Rudanella paleaurantiibacter TaxID=2614655 RepID=A0A7J5TTX0_9BACT|nr:sensor protein KdpD [Rudanella paleaurantiibacter]KAB7727326.1 sensor protein KdpD [Rudanella paleaurantiibacter]